MENWMICKHVMDGAAVAEEAFCPESTTALCESCHQILMERIQGLNDSDVQVELRNMEGNFRTICGEHLRSQLLKAGQEHLAREIDVQGEGRVQSLPG